MIMEEVLPSLVGQDLVNIPMITHKFWKILCWNVRGLNSNKKWNSIRDKVLESCCDIVYLQETKRAHFDAAFTRNICP